MCRFLFGLKSKFTMWLDGIARNLYLIDMRMRFFFFFFLFFFEKMAAFSYVLLIVTVFFFLFKLSVHLGETLKN